MIEKLRYLVESAVRTAARNGRECPSCGAKPGDTVSRKYLVTALRRCRQCAILYRSPTTSAEHAKKYYQHGYQSGLTTEMPSSSDLLKLKASRFASTQKCFDRYVNILHALGCRKGDRLLDFGCSWGYGSWQFQEAGFEVVGFDVSEPRVAYARQQLGVDAKFNIEEIDGPFDILFSSHVLEHLPSVNDALALGFRALRAGGIFVAITPNGSLKYRERNPRSWQRFWGLKHPNLLDEDYYTKQFQTRPYLLTSRLDDLQLMEKWSANPLAISEQLDGWELMAVCKNELVIKAT